MENNNEVKKVETEEVANSFQELINRELVKYDKVVPAMAELNKSYMSLSIKSIITTITNRKF